MNLIGVWIWFNDCSMNLIGWLEYESDWMIGVWIWLDDWSMNLIGWLGWTSNNAWPASPFQHYCWNIWNSIWQCPRVPFPAMCWRRTLPFWLKWFPTTTMTAGCRWQWRRRRQEDDDDECDVSVSQTCVCYLTKIAGMTKCFSNSCFWRNLCLGNMFPFLPKQLV